MFFIQPLCNFIKDILSINRLVLNTNTMKTILKITYFFILLCITTASNAQWQKLNGPEGLFMMDFERVNNQIWVGAMDGIYISSDEGLTWSKSNLVPGVCSGIKNYNDTVVVLYVDLAYDSYALKSITSFDNGNTWNSPVMIDSELGSYLNTGNDLIKTSEALFAKSFHRYYRSTDDGMTWQNVSTPFGFVASEIMSDGNGALITKSIPTSPYRAYYFTSDGVSPLTYIDSTVMSINVFLNNNVILLSYMNLVDSEFVWIRTDDFGNSWDTVLLSPMMSYYGYGIYNYNNMLYITNSFITFESADNGATWQSGVLPSEYLLIDGVQTTSGNTVTSYYKSIVTYFPATDTILPTMTGVAGLYINSLFSNKNVLFCSDQQSLYRSVDGGLTWTNLNVWYGPIDRMIFDGDTIYAIENDYTSLLARSYDNGITWDTLNTLNNNSQGLSIAKINGRLFLSRDSVFYSDDQGLTWNPFPELPSATTGGCQTVMNVYEIVMSVFNDELWAVNNSGYVFKFDSSTQSWVNKFCVWSIGAFPENEVRVMDQVLLLRNRSEMHISQDSGATWVESLYNGLPLNNNGEPIIPKGCIQIGGTWFGTCSVYGVYFSNDLGNTWQPLSLNPEFIARGGLTNLNNVLYAGSYFDGVWRRANPFINLSGQVFYDLNANGIKDPGEVPLSNIVVTTTPSGFFATTKSNGNYSMVSDMTGTIKAISPTVLGNINPASYSFIGDTSGLDFAFVLDSGIYDLSIDMTNVNVFNPGFQTVINVTGKNNGSEPQSAEIRVKLDTVLQYFYAIPSPTNIINDTLIWNTSVLNYNDTAQIKVFVQTAFGTPLGYFVNSTAMILPIANDTIPSDNIYFLSDTVVASYDPNDKTCLQGTYFTPAQLADNEELEYVIRFQNTGTFPTNFVIITDTLSHLFDPATLRIISASHPMTWELNSQGVLTVTFDPLALPPSIIDEPGSHGFVKYGIKCKETVVLGNALANTANIYFDFNTPVITNTAITLIADLTILSEPDVVVSKEEGILVYPNPARDEINIVSDKLNSGTSTVSLFNSRGQSVYSQSINSAPCRIDVSGLPAGLYIGRVSNHQGELIGSFRLMKLD